MKNTIRLFRLLLVLPLVSAGLASAAESKPAATQPELKIDRTPVVSSGTGPVATYADQLEGVRSAVVSVYSTKIVREQIPDIYRQLFGPGVQGREQKQDGLGSGVIVSADGYILTNNHVVEDADELKVSLNDDREFTAKVIGTDPKTDIAVIKIDATDLPAATLGDSDKLRVGDVVFAIGNPLGVGQTVTMGIVSALGRKNVNLLTDRDPEAYEDFIQTDAAINFGNSGGALVDARGRLIGINSGIATNNRGNIGIGFAVPISLARYVMASLIAHGRVERGYVGVSASTLTPKLASSFGLPEETRGAIIMDVAPEDGPAAKAGLKRDDIITAINDRPVSSWEDLRINIAQLAPGSTAKVHILRDGKASVKEVVLGSRNEMVAENIFPGVTLEPLTAEIRRDLRLSNNVEGLAITEVAPSSPYAGVFPVGAVIVEINRAPASDLVAARKALQPTGNRALIYYRGVFRYIIFDLP